MAIGCEGEIEPAKLQCTYPHLDELVSGLSIGLHYTKTDDLPPIGSPVSERGSQIDRRIWGYICRWCVPALVLIGDLTS